jgi:hypothetical protein
MSTADFHRLCPKCHTRRGVDEVLCANEVDGASCGWDLTNEEIRESPLDGEGEAQPQKRCPSGHPVSDGDLICPECNADLGDADPLEVIAGWVVLAQLPTESGVRTR